MTLVKEEVCRELDFYNRTEEEQNDFLAMTWCNDCQEMDLGMEDPKEYYSDSRHWIAGKCKVCKTEVITEIQEGDEE
ncbi:hypothetical protein O1D97_17835 [Marinomonas sp. 15G1-11]|uniref:Phage protein n=1 Tax=Marinomonas phaeophyticola TaxID=3004091 RepID=A0ABT4JYR9_9GAMM|nr:hypothetical protein [Marinomonas sp. 15G1-11]MCZ2723418.1 hypothetical protein [Marinomonas sp. 15G1-11]